MELSKDYAIPALCKKPGRPAKYPLRTMEVGDSFLVPIDVVESVRSAANNVSTRTRAKFTVRRLEDGTVRCWRTA